MSTTHVPDPDQSREAARVKRRQELQERFERLADCRTSRDQAVIAAFHDHLASSGLRDCGACGAVLADAAPDPGRPFAAAEAPAVVRYVASAPVEDDAGAAAVALRSLKGFLHPLLAFSLGTALMGCVLLATGLPEHAVILFGLSLAGIAAVAALRRMRL